MQTDNQKTFFIRKKSKTEIVIQSLTMIFLPTIISINHKKTKLLQNNCNPQTVPITTNNLNLQTNNQSAFMITKLFKQINLKSINFFIKTSGTDKKI